MEQVSLGSIETGARAALDQALLAWHAGGLPCGASLVGDDGGLAAVGRNHAYDDPTGSDILENTPLAHAELNVLARVPTDRDLSGDTLWSTQQPCAMCESAIAFCGVGTVRFLATDPSSNPDDPDEPVSIDPTEGRPEMTPVAVLANAMFLQPFIARGLEETLNRNRSMEPETVELADILARSGPPIDLEGLFVSVAADLERLATARVTRLANS